MRNRGKWTTVSKAYLEHIHHVIHSLRDYIPLTLRQIFYPLVTLGIIQNTKNEYKKLSRILTKARLDGLIDWSVIEDRARTILRFDGWDDASQFIDSQIDDFLIGYRRDLLQSQDVMLEVWVEKDTLVRVCERAAAPYCIPVVVARGFSSVSYLYDFARRAASYQKYKGKSQTIILYFGDFDPSGWEMLPAMLETLQREMGLRNRIRGDRIVLTLEQIEQYNLPHSIEGMKDTDSRTPKFKALLHEWGCDENLAVELDALPPAKLEELIRNAIEERLDMEAFREEQDTEESEMGEIEDLKEDMRKFIKENRGQ